MNLRRFTVAHVAAGGLLCVAIVACDTSAPVAVPDAALESRIAGLQDPVTLETKRQDPGWPAGAGGPISPLLYGVEPIPYVEGPRDLPNTMTLCDDCVLNDVPIGFDFTFYGNTYSTLQISSNGFVRFDPANNDSGCCSGRPIPLDDLWNNIIAFGWTDLIPIGGQSGAIRFGTVGEAPNRRFILHADSVRNFGNPPPARNLSAWLVLYEGSNVVELHTEFWTPHTQNQTQGLENIDGTQAHFAPGRVATLFTLAEDGVRFTPEQVIDVDVHDAYSGDPRQDPGVVDLADEWVYVEILDPLSFTPARAAAIPFRSASDVRIGATFETGVPAESFELLDISGDGVTDIRLRWDRQALQAAGQLPVGPTTLRIWGRDPGDGQLYRAAARVTVVLPGDLLFENCGLVTHPGAGVGGFDVSMSSPGVLNIAGLNHRHFPPDPFFRVADDFTVPDGGWTVNALVTHGYETGSATPTWTAFHMNIWDGVPGEPGSAIVATSTSASISFAGIYRTFNGVLLSTERPVHRIIWDLGSLDLDPGTYWADWQVQGGSSGWAPMCMLPDPAGGDNTITVSGNARQLTPDGWVPTLDADRPGDPAEFPFLVIGAAPGLRLPAWTPADHGIPTTTQVRRTRPDVRAHDTPQQ